MQVRLWSGPIFILSPAAQARNSIEPATPNASNPSGRHNFGNTKWPALRGSDFGFDVKALLDQTPMPSWLSSLALRKR
jgi:hypothetical protein